MKRPSTSPASRPPLANSPPPASRSALAPGRPRTFSPRASLPLRLAYLRFLQGETHDLSPAYLRLLRIIL
jgi:hypothetical protein